MIISKHIFGGQNSLNGNLHGIQKKYVVIKPMNCMTYFGPNSPFSVN